MASCALAYGLLITGPALAWLYAVVALLFLWAWHECRLNCMTRARSLRTAFLVAAVAVAIGLCQGDAPLEAILPIGLVASLASICFIAQTRINEIEGGPPPTFDDDCMKGEVVLVTGANAGIGKETVRQLASMGATVILGCRSESRAVVAMDDVRASLNGKMMVDLRFLPLDLADLESVRQAAVIFLQMKLPLHVLVNNAGVMMGQKTMTTDGYELMMQANHLAHFLLTLLLLPKLKESGGRVVTVTSSTYCLAKNGFDFEDIFCNSTRKYTLFGQYAQSKLANILFAKELARRHPDILSCAAHPGLVRTDVVRNMPWYLYYPNTIFGVFVAALQKKPKQGAYTSVWCAASKASPENGSYCVNCKVQETNNHATNVENAKRLWDLSEELVYLKQ
jgi:NAD(P)-dependent dehydrogenase (short-subunit alcohol dehydrogenase family)